MTDLDPAQTEAVRRALAAARHDSPMPAGVAARLDATLAELTDLTAADAADSVPQVAAAMVAPAPAHEPADEPGVATVIPFRRRLPVLLAAAAAVVAVAVATPQFINRSGHSDSTAARSIPRATESGGDSAAEDKAIAPMTVPERSGTLDQSLKSSMGAAAGVTDLHEATLRPQLRTMLAEHQQYGSAQAPETANDDLLAGDVPAPIDGITANAYRSQAVPRCGPSEPPVGARLFAARFEGHRAVVVAFGATADGTPVQIYDCRIAPRVPTRLLTVPAPD